MNESGQKGGRRDRRIELGNEYGIGGMDEHEKNTMNTWITSNQRSQIFIIQHVSLLDSHQFLKRGERTWE